MNLTDKKVVFAAQVIALADHLLLGAQRCDDLNAAYSVNAFASGSANQFTDADFAVNAPHMSAAIMADVMYAIGVLAGALTTGIRNSFREALPGGLP